jgi:biopolymer transport protein ExbB/TolQ
MLGLMGTLIPMGPALVALANGNISSMAMNMQVAFSTTVLGIFIGAIGFVTHSVKSRWHNEEIANLQYALEVNLHSEEENQ